MIFDRLRPIDYHGAMRPGATGILIYVNIEKG